MGKRESAARGSGEKGEDVSFADGLNEGEDGEDGIEEGASPMLTLTTLPLMTALSSHSYSRSEWVTSVANFISHQKPKKKEKHTTIRIGCPTLPPTADPRLFAVMSTATSNPSRAETQTRLPWTQHS
jgi:hypothetical protein